MIAQKLKNNRIALGNSAPRKDALEVIDDLKTAEFCRLFKAAREWNESINDNRDIVFTQYENEHSKVCKEFNYILERRKSFEKKFTQSKMEEFLSSSKNTKAKKEIGPTKLVDENKEVEEVKKAPIIIWASKVKGTSRLLRIPKKQIIKIVRRKGLIDDNNRPNSVCITNALREEFFADCKNCNHFHQTNLYELMYDENDHPDIYKKWDDKVTEIYNQGVPKID